MVAIGIVELLVLAVMLSTLLITLVAFIDIVRTPGSAWKSAGQIQVLWLVLVLAFPVLGSLAYFIMVRGDVAAANKGIEGAMA